jgi:hypothetical protein
MLGIVCSIKLIKETMSMASIPTQEEVLAATRKSQEAMVAAVKNWLETVRTATPKLTSVYALTDKLPKLSDVGLPFADKLPTPQDAVASAYHLAEQLLASQRKFAEELVKVTAPLRPGYRENSTEVPSRNAWQEAVTDRAPKTPAASTPPKAVASTPPAKAPAPSTPPAKAPVASTPPVTPAASTPPKAPVTSTPATTAVASTPAKAPAASAPAKAPVTSTPATTAAASTPAKAPAASTPAKAAPARPAVKSTTAKSAPKSAAAGSARKSAGTKTATPKGTDAS